MGAATAAGLGVPALWQAAREGESAIGPLEVARELRHNIRIAGQLRGFDPAAHIEPQVLAFCDRFTQLAIVAGDEALAQAGFARGDRLGERTATIVGTGIGGGETIEQGIHNAYVTGQRLDPWSVPLTVSEPIVGAVMPHRICSRVDLPEPLRPTMPTAAPLGMVKPISFSAQYSS